LKKNLRIAFNKNEGTAGHRKEYSDNCGEKQEALLQTN
jgi:hypothetical protein